MAVNLNKNSFWLHSQLTAFCIKNNPRENRFFAASGRLADEKGTHNVKILAENYTKKQLCRKHARGQTVRKARALTAICASGCKACSPRPTATELWKCRSNPPLADSFRLMEKGLNNFCQGTFWYIIAFYHGQMGLNLWSYRIFVLCCIHGEECLSWFWHTKIKHSSQL